VSTLARPDPSLFAAVFGQERAVAQLRAAAQSPVHAYLLVGPAGSGKRAAAIGFAAALLCPEGGCGHCAVCRRVTGGTHSDVVVAARSGAFIHVDQAKEIARIAALSPREGHRKVLVLVDFHLVQHAAPVLLKTIEEPPPGTVFVILAEYVPPELVTIASRCVRLDFDLVPEERITAALVADGVDAAAAADAARASGGRVDRARLLADDVEVPLRRAAWQLVPARLDGTGATAAVVAAELLALVMSAGSDALMSRHAGEMAELEERAAITGERGSGRRELEERHRREQRRLRTDELRLGLATLEAAYRDRAAAAAVSATATPASGAGAAARAALESARTVQRATQAIERNPNEALLLQTLMVRLTSR
jgi:DNA polymerase-3 subunit delta'